MYYVHIISLMTSNTMKCIESSELPKTPLLLLQNFLEILMLSFWDIQKILFQEHVYCVLIVNTTL